MKILVVGDSCTDKFIYGKVDRVSPEAPIPVFNPQYETENYGMAANVASNLASFGLDCDLITNKTKIIKTRYVDMKSKQMLLRVDENDLVLDKDAYLNQPITGYDAIIISDYNKGFLNKESIKKLLDNKVPTFLQSNKLLDTWCLSADFIKINEKEYQISKNFIDINKKEFFENLIVTLGENGYLYKNKHVELDKKVDVRDVSGAGDTFLSAFVFSYLDSLDPIIALKYAQKQSSIIVQKTGINVAGNENLKFNII